MCCSSLNECCFFPSKFLSESEGGATFKVYHCRSGVFALVSGEELQVGQPLFCDQPLDAVCRLAFPITTSSKWDFVAFPLWLHLMVLINVTLTSGNYHCCWWTFGIMSCYIIKMFCSVTDDPPWLKSRRWVITAMMMREHGSIRWQMIVKLRCWICKATLL